MIAVLTGGKSSERDVSLYSAQTMIESLKNLQLDFIQIDIADDNWTDQLSEVQPEVALLAIHGTYAEDGQLQTALERMGIKYTGSSSKSCRRAFNKSMSKDIVSNLGIRVPKNYKENEVNSFPVVVKPNSEGSSVGVSIVHNLNELDSAILSAKKYDPHVLIEEFITGKELCCGVIDVFGWPQALPIIEIQPKNEFFDYESKYTAGMATETCPANLDEQIAEDIASKSLQVFKELKIDQYCRIDYILKGSIPYFLEVNTLPGMTKTSLIPQELKAANIKLDSFILKLIETASIHQDLKSYE